jgi:hypothetical protein
MVLAGVGLTGGALAEPFQHPAIFDVDASGHHSTRSENACGTMPPSFWVQVYADGVARGLVPSPIAGPEVVPAAVPQPLGPPDPTPCLTREHIFVYEDASSVLLTDFGFLDLLTLMVNAYNAMIGVHGDSYDFAGFFLNYTPHHTIGDAFYLPVFNDVSGIGDSIFDNRATFAVGASNRIQGLVVMWEDSSWVGGTTPAADYTRLVLAHEFEHRFAMYLPALLSGQQLQGDDASCGRSMHWNWRVDGQGSAMEISEWVGSNPATLGGSFVNFNADIVGGGFSYTDLYLMGYVSPAEMDAGNSELRYMDTSDCASDYSGTISTFDSSDVIAAAGARVPDAAASQKDFRTGWIMLHLPGSPPTNAELDHVVSILEQQQIDWNFSTHGRGTWNNTLFTDVDCDGVPDTGAELFCDASDGSLSACPCGNAGDPETGCDIQQGTGGVLMSLAARQTAPQNRVTWSGSGFPAMSFATSLVIRSTGLDAASPLVFGDGLRCIGTPLVRLAATFSSVGSVTHTHGHGTMAGSGSFFYQLWFRNTPIMFCDPAAAFNLSNGRILNW